VVSGGNIASPLGVLGGSPLLVCAVVADFVRVPATWLEDDNGLPNCKRVRISGKGPYGAFRVHPPTITCSEIAVGLPRANERAREI